MARAENDALGEPLTNRGSGMYQLRVVLRGISPLIWRRLHIRGNRTIEDVKESVEVRSSQAVRPGGPLRGA